MVLYRSISSFCYAIFDNGCVFFLIKKSEYITQNIKYRFLVEKLWKIAILLNLIAIQVFDGLLNSILFDDLTIDDRKLTVKLINIFHTMSVLKVNLKNQFSYLRNQINFEFELAPCHEIN